MCIVGFPANILFSTVKLKFCWASTTAIQSFPWELRFLIVAVIWLEDMAKWWWSQLWPTALQWSHNERDGASNHRRLECLFSRLFRLTSNKISKPALLAHFQGNKLMTGGFPSQRASNAETVSLLWRHHGLKYLITGNYREICDLIGSFTQFHQGIYTFQGVHSSSNFAMAILFWQTRYL